MSHGRLTQVAAKIPNGPSQHASNEFTLRRLSPPQVLESAKLKQEVTQIEEERIQVLNNVEELELKIKDLDNQMEESVREVGASQRRRSS